MKELIATIKETKEMMLKDGAHLVGKDKDTLHLFVGILTELQTRAEGVLSRHKAAIEKERAEIIVECNPVNLSSLQEIYQASKGKRGKLIFREEK